MAYEFGTVKGTRPDGGIEIAGDNQTIYRISPTQLEQFGIAHLHEGSRVRLTIHAGQIEKVTILSAVAAGIASGQPDQPTDTDIPPARDSRDTKLPVNETASTVWRRGKVLGIGTYHGAVEDEQQRQYSYRTNRFASLSLRVGDVVLFRHDDAIGEIIEMQLIERAASGRGQSHPCDDNGLSTQIERPAIRQLITRLCEEQRLSWHWISPPKAEDAQDAAIYLEPDMIAIIRRKINGFHKLFAHQAIALDALRSGSHVMVLTPTASGKTLCYNPAVLAALQSDPAATALYVFPLNALMLDQKNTLDTLAEGLVAHGVDVRIGHLRGGMDKADRDEVIKRPPRVIVTNPEMLAWLLDQVDEGGLRQFIRNLRFIVLDEAHVYRGVPVNIGVD